MFGLSLVCKYGCFSPLGSSPLKNSPFDILLQNCKVVGYGKNMDSVSSYLNTLKKLGVELVNSFQPSVAFHIETSHLYCRPIYCPRLSYCNKLWRFAHLVPFIQFKKREKHPLGSVIFSKIGGFSLQLQ